MSRWTDLLLFCHQIYTGNEAPWRSQTLLPTSGTPYHLAENHREVLGPSGQWESSAWRAVHRFNGPNHTAAFSSRSSITEAWDKVREINAVGLCNIPPQIGERRHIDYRIKVDRPVCAPIAKSQPTACMCPFHSTCRQHVLLASVYDEAMVKGLTAMYALVALLSLAESSQLASRHSSNFVRNVPPQG